MDRGLNELLKWSIENSANGGSDSPAGVTTTTTFASPAAGAPRVPDQEAMAALFGNGPSDAELMKAAVSVITDPDPGVELDDRLVAFDNLEQLIENLDNANNLSALSLWSPLLLLLEHEERELRRMAAWCVGTAVQNNPPCQERLLAMGGIPRLVGIAAPPSSAANAPANGDEVRKEEGGETKEDHPAVRKKAIYALSSAVRNYQPALDVAVEELAKRGYSYGKVDATNMDAVDGVIDALKESLNTSSGQTAS